MESKKVYLLYFLDETPLVFENLADAEEMYMELTVESYFDCFCEWFHFWNFSFEESLAHPDEVCECCYIEESILL